MILPPPGRPPRAINEYGISTAATGFDDEHRWPTDTCPVSPRTNHPEQRRIQQQRQLEFGRQSAAQLDAAADPAGRYAAAAGGSQSAASDER